MTQDLYLKQAAFLDSQALYRGFAGGRGAGKSFIGAYDMLRRAQPGRLYGVYAPSYPMMRDATQRSFLTLAQRMHYLRDVKRGDNQLTLGNGAEVLFRSLDDPERARGPNLSGAWIDEASLVPRSAFDIIIGALREGGEQGWLSATFTPKGRGHWTYDVFGRGAPDSALIQAATRENPFLPAEFANTLRAQYTALLAEQELQGHFIDVAGALFRREWFGIVDTAPADMRRLRYWDLAATDSKTADFTAGALLGEHGGVYYLIDMRHMRGTPMQVESLVHQTAELDGHNVHVWMEQEPGSSGVNTIDHYTRRVLPGWTFRGNRATGSKPERAMPFAAQAEAGNVKILRGAWNGAFLDECESFPQGEHDDMVDAAAGAFERLAKRGLPFGFVPIPDRMAA